MDSEDKKTLAISAVSFGAAAVYGAYTYLYIRKQKQIQKANRLKEEQIIAWMKSVREAATDKDTAFDKKFRQKMDEALKPLRDQNIIDF